VSRDLDIDVQALAYLVTVLIHRLHESDPSWWRESRDELKTDQASAPVGTIRDKVLQKAIGIVEDSMKGHDGK
jgi:hypothetical protein